MKPFFIGGCDRSGTTMLGALLGSHPECLCIPESQFKIPAYRIWQEQQESVDQVNLLKWISQQYSFKIWNVNIDALSISEKFSTFQNTMDWVVSQYGQSLGRDHFHSWVDHTPNNIQYGKMLLDMFPNAKIIHIVRDGRAVASSILDLDWGPNQIDKAANYWLKRLAFGFALELFCKKDQVYRVRYEDVLLDTENTIKKICGFLGLQFYSCMLNNNGFQVPLFTACQHALVGKPLDLTRVNSWKSSLLKRQIEIFEHIAGEMLLYLDYDLCFKMQRKGMSKLERRTSDIKEIVKTITNKRKHYKRLKQALQFP